MATGGLIGTGVGAIVGNQSGRALEGAAIGAAAGALAGGLYGKAKDQDRYDAAAANGADAVYFGLPFHNARMRADNFRDEELPEIMGYLHRHGLRGFVTMNTLVFSGELGAAARQLEKLGQAGVDAVLVQDLGLARLAREVAPNVELHASTQMTVSSPEGLAFAHELVGLDRVVLARELSLKDIGAFAREMERGRCPKVPLEVFVHGALCVAYSGQCLTSEALGRRSANRGECAQACRMPYTMLVDGEERDLGDRRYLLSPQDLAAHSLVGDLLRLGVRSFKIEGRLKSPEYVAAVTGVYRKALDAALEGRRPDEAVDAADRYRLEMTFSRGLSTGWLEGTNHPRLVHARFGKKRGPFLGNIVRVARDHVELDRPAQAKPGDGIVFDTGGDPNHETGGRIVRVEGRRLFLPPGRIPRQALRRGHRVWKTSDPALDAELRATWKRRLPRRPLHVLDLRVEAAPGQALRIRELRTGAEVRSRQPLERAKSRPLDRATLEKQLSRLGDTEFRLGSLDAQITGEAMAPLSLLNQLRRELVAEVERRLRPDSTKAKPASAALKELLPEPGSRPPEENARLSVLVRSMEQLEAALESGAGEIIVDFEDIRRARDAVERFREAAKANDGAAARRIFLATPRIHKPRESGHFRVLEAARPDGLLLRSLGALHFFRNHPDFLLHADFTLNLANPLSARLLRESAGLERLTISYDLDIPQVLDLLSAAPPGWFELTLHQHMPMFHMEHCVFCAFLSEGTDYRNCGHPCEKHRVHLRDRVGMLHILQADVGCRNTVFRGQAQTGAPFFSRLRAAGLRHFRIELLQENRTESQRTIRLYQNLLSGRTAPDSLWRTLKAETRLGVTKGTFASS